ncbi:MAG: TadE/TadG family type IV pilus assembly protein [Jatrophihabitantaceae bacterium]
MTSRLRASDEGNAIIEFVFVAIVVLMPLIYLIVAVAVVQRSNLAVTQAAREAGRAFATSDRPDQTAARVNAAVRLALEDQGLDEHVELRYVAADASCAASPVQPRLSPGAQFAICVSRRVELPAVPSVLAGRGITTVGRYVVHVDDFRAAP